MLLKHLGLLPSHRSKLQSVGAVSVKRHEHFYTGVPLLHWNVGRTGWQAHLPKGKLFRYASVIGTCSHNAASYWDVLLLRLIAKNENSLQSLESSERCASGRQLIWNGGSRTVTRLEKVGGRLKPYGFGWGQKEPMRNTPLSRLQSRAADLRLLSVWRLPKVPSLGKLWVNKTR